MTGGSSPIGYLKAWHTNLYLSADADKVREALAEGEGAMPLQHYCLKEKMIGYSNWLCRQLEYVLQDK